MILTICLRCGSHIWKIQNNGSSELQFVREVIIQEDGLGSDVDEALLEPSGLHAHL